jgi:inhibitor of growth protein 4
MFAVYRDNYIEGLFSVVYVLYCMRAGLEHLPIELQRNFTLMRDLDARAQALMRNIDRLADEYLRNVKSLTPEKKKEQMNNIQSLFNKAKEYGDDKVQLAIQTYELVRF